MVDGAGDGQEPQPDMGRAWDAMRDGSGLAALAPSRNPTTRSLVEVCVVPVKGDGDFAPICDLNRAVLCGRFGGYATLCGAAIENARTVAIGPRRRLGRRLNLHRWDGVRT